MQPRRFREREHKARACDECHETYYRRNIYGAWVRQQVGSRIGWVWAIVRVCTKCQPERQAARAMIVAQTNIIKQGGNGGGR